MLLAMAALIAAACNRSAADNTPAIAQQPTVQDSHADHAGDTGASGTTDAAERHSDHHGDGGTLQPDAADMEVVLTSPRADEQFEGLTLPFTVAVQGFRLSPELAGKHPVPGTGHYHVYLDDSLYNMFFTTEASVSLRNLEPGPHTLRVVPAQNDHVEIDGNGDEVTFDYDPESPPPLIRPATFSDEPSIRILSPRQGEVVTGDFEVVVEVDGFNLTCELLGRPDVAGYGHWHLNLDNEAGGLGGLLGMTCQERFTASTAGLRPGSIHTFHATLTGNGHGPLGPRAQDAVQVRIGD